MENKIPIAPGVGRPNRQKAVREDKISNQFQSDKKDLASYSTSSATHANYHYFLSSASVIDLKDPIYPYKEDGSPNYKTYIAIRGDKEYFNFFEYDKYSLWEAVNAAMTLVDCVNCFNCEMCVECRNCVNLRLETGLDGMKKD